MNCQDFLARYSEYLDDRLHPMEAARWRYHASKCRACARYDRVLRGGLDLVRELPAVEPSDEFFARLQHRLFHVDDDLDAGQRASGASAVLSLAIAGVLAVVAWSPLMRPDPVTVDLAPVTARAPESRAGSAAAAGRIAGESAGPGRSGVWLFGSPELTPAPTPVGGAGWWSVDRPRIGFASSSYLPDRNSSFYAPGPFTPLIFDPATLRPVEFPGGRGAGLQTPE